jgi:hypothetical protein
MHWNRQCSQWSKSVGRFKGWECERKTLGRPEHQLSMYGASWIPQSFKLNEEEGKGQIADVRMQNSLLMRAHEFKIEGFRVLMFRSFAYLLLFGSFETEAGLGEPFVEALVEAPAIAAELLRGYCLRSGSTIPHSSRYDSLVP